MSRWFRMYDEVVDDPKVQRLSDALFRAWVNIMCVASKNGGALPFIDDVAFKLRTTPAKTIKIIDALRDAILLDNLDGKFVPHNWNGRQFKTDVSTERVKLFRKRSNGVSPPVSETTPETDTETEKKMRARRADDWPEDYFDQFWEPYPNKVGKPDALKALQRVRNKGKVSFAALLEAWRRYIAKTDDRPWCNPATWIRQGRWDDQPAPPNGGKPPTIPGII